MDEINGTITASAQPENCGIPHPTQNRRYTIREIARIQTFPDDFVFNFNNKQADGSASRGETRSIILALKFIEASIIYEVLNKKPIILLDDVFSELDEVRQKSLIKNFKNNQVILTSVDEVKL